MGAPALSVQQGGESTPRLVVTAKGTFLAGRSLFRGGTDALLSHFGSLLEAGGRHLVMTPNVDQVVSMRGNADTRRGYTHAAVRIADGTPLVALARLLGDKSITRLTGADLLLSVAEASKQNGWTVAIAGGDHETSIRAATKLQAENPGSTLVSVPFPVLSSVDDPRSHAVIDELWQLEPQVVFLCLGSPKQEAWFLEWRDRLPNAIYVGAGAAVEFAAGTRRRAPRIAQSLGAEWIWRLAQEPKRLAHRYLVRGPLFLSVIFSSLIHHRPS